MSEEGGKTSGKKLIRNSTAEFLRFTAEEGQGSIEARFDSSTIWLTQKLMAELFSVDVRTVSEHLRNVFDEGELAEDAVIRKFRITASDGKSYTVKHYNLDAIISVGYRVNSLRATQFRQWATVVLRDFALKGFALDRERLENGTYLGEDYFEELLAEIREIRMSERRFYQKVTDIYATSLGYDPHSPISQQFFATVQNKLHYAIHGHTAAELIMERADSGEEHMGLTSWKNAPEGKIIRTDVAVAKNYLTAEEIDGLSRLVSRFLDDAEERARRRIPMTMEDWANRLDAFLEFDDRAVLKDAGQRSAKQARSKALGEFEKYRVLQDEQYVSDFDRFVAAAEHAARSSSEAAEG